MVPRPLLTPARTLSSRAPVVVNWALIAARLAVSVSVRPSVRASAGLASVLSSRVLSARNDFRVCVSSAAGPVFASASVAIARCVVLSVAWSWFIVS